MKAVFNGFILLLSILLAISIYRAFVVFQKCSHKLEKIDGSNKILVNDDHVERLRNALRIHTITIDHIHQNETALDLYLKFIRKGKKNPYQVFFTRF